MPQGTIKKLTDRDFGFIKGEHGDVFFHNSAVTDTTFEQLHEGQAVEYEEEQGPKARPKNCSQTASDRPSKMITIKTARC